MPETRQDAPSRERTDPAEHEDDAVELLIGNDNAAEWPELPAFDDDGDGDDEDGAITQRTPRIGDPGAHGESN